MVVVQALLAMVARSAGKVLNTAFGWATSMLFGKVPEDRQIYLSVLSFGSVAWLVVLLGIIFPSFATWLLSFVPLPDWVDEGWVRIAMLVAAVIIPLVIGGVSIFMLDRAERPKTIGGKAKAVLKGYPYTLGLAVTLVMMTVFAPVLKVRDMIKRWTSQHIPIVVESPQYLAVVGDVQQALAQGGLETRREQATWMLRLPTKVLTMFAGGAVENLVADELTTLKSDNIEVLLHPSDLIVSGRELDASHAHAIITEQLTFTDAHLTWTKEANELEERLRALWHGLRERGDGALDPDLLRRLRAIEQDMRQLRVDYEEWEVLFRERMQVERGLLHVAAGLVDRPGEPTDAHPDELSTARRLPQTSQGSRSDTTVVEIPLPSRLLGPVFAASVAVAAIVGVAWNRLFGGRGGAFG